MYDEDTMVYKELQKSTFGTCTHASQVCNSGIAVISLGYLAALLRDGVQCVVVVCLYTKVGGMCP
jgi:hypothetical protein